MVFRLRLESKALEDLENKETIAAGQGPAAFSAFQKSSEETAIIEGAEIGANLGGENSGGSSSSSTDDSSDSDSGDSDSGDDFDLDAPDFDEGDSGGDDSSADDSGGDDSGGDGSSDNDNSDDEEIEADKEADKEAEVKKESFRTLSFLPGEEPNIRMESMFPSGNSGGFISTTWNGLSFVVGALASIGIRYTPMLLGGMFKIVLFTFAKTFITLDSIFTEVATRVERYLKNTELQKGSLKSLQKRVEELKSQNAILPPDTVVKANIDALVTAESVDLTANVKAYSIFLDKKMGGFQKGILSEFNGLKTIASSRYLQKNFEPLEFMTVTPEEVGFTSRYPSNKDSEDTVSLYGMGPMIGQVEMRAYLPAGHFDTWNTVEKSYTASNLFVAALNARSTQKATPMELGQLGEFLNELELLAEASITHQALYKEIANSRSGVINSVKQLFIRLCEETVKVSFKNSVALPLHLKSNFVTKVYLTGALDLHDHTARVIANGLSYADAMLKLYRTDAK